MKYDENGTKRKTQSGHMFLFHIEAQSKQNTDTFLEISTAYGHTMAFNAIFTTKRKGQCLLQCDGIERV